MVSQHALQVSRPTPRGAVERDLTGGVSRPTPKGEVEGDLARGSPGRHLGGPTLGGCLVPGGSALGVPGLGGVVWRPSRTATAADGTHPTAMHSCSWIFFRVFQN